MTAIPLPGLAFLTTGTGTTEVIVVFVAILLLFGPKRLPEIVRMIGRAMDELRKASQEFKSQIMSIEDEARNATRDVIDGAMRDEEADEENGYYDDYEEDPDAWRDGDGQDDTEGVDKAVDDGVPSRNEEDLQTTDPSEASPETSINPTNPTDEDEGTRTIAG